MQQNFAQTPAEEDIRERESLQKGEEAELFAGAVRMPVENAVGLNVFCLLRAGRQRK